MINPNNPIKDPRKLNFIHFYLQLQKSESESVRTDSVALNLTLSLITLVGQGGRQKRQNLCGFVVNALQLTIKISTATSVFRFTLTLETTQKQMVKNGSSANVVLSGSILSVKLKMATQIFLNFFAKIVLKAFSTFASVVERKKVKFLLRVSQKPKRNPKLRTLQSITLSQIMNQTQIKQILICLRCTNYLQLTLHVTRPLGVCFQISNCLAQIRKQKRNFDQRRMKTRYLFLSQTLARSLHPYTRSQLLTSDRAKLQQGTARLRLPSERSSDCILIVLAHFSLNSIIYDLSL